MKKHQINIITAQPNENGWRAKTTKTFKLGYETDNYHNKWWKQNIIEWDSLAELHKIIKPYIEGTHEDSHYSALMYGQFRPHTEEPFGTRRTNINVDDTPHNYLILDIETDSPHFGEICSDLSKVRHWLIETYPWITERSGMILYHTASSCVVRHDGSDKHKQIRVRAIMEITSAIPLQESDRKHLLRPYMKNQGKDFLRHIDNATHQKARLFYMAPPILTETERTISEGMTCLYEGEPIDFESLRDFDIGLPGVQAKTVNSDGVSSPVATLNKTIDGDKLTKDLKTKDVEYWWDKIADGNRYEGHYYMLLSAYYHNQIREWRTKLLNDKFKLGDKTPQSIDTVIAYIEENVVKDFDKPTDKIQNHNVIDIDTYRLSNWNDTIAWKDKGVILQKLYEGAGKTESLKQLKQMADEKGLSFLYIAPNTKPVVQTCIDLGLTCYQDIGHGVADISSDGQPIHRFLGICYPSLEKYDTDYEPGEMSPIKYDIVAMDEIEQLLMFGVDGGGCVINPQKANGILRHFVEKANLVVGMDARLSNLTLQALETWRVEDDVFDIYTQSKVKPWDTKNFTIVDSRDLAMQEIKDAVRSGKKVAIVSELDRGGKGFNLESAKTFIEEQTGIKGYAIDQKNKETTESNRYVNELGEYTDEGKEIIGALAKDLKDGVISHFWSSPVLQSAWSYKSEEQPFDLVVGLYPNSVLTAPNIVQHISRFRTSNEYVLFVQQHKKWRPKDIYKRMHHSSSKKGIDLELGEFNLRHELHDKWEHIQKDNRESHVIEIIESRGGNIQYKHSKLTDKNKELTEWLREHEEEAWAFLRSNRPFAIYNKIKQNEEPLYELD